MVGISTEAKVAPGAPSTPFDWSDLLGVTDYENPQRY
ncbi:hypothetical protein VPHK459_0098 [Vibrio phage K459]